MDLALEMAAHSHCQDVCDNRMLDFLFTKLQQETFFDTFSPYGHGWIPEEYWAEWQAIFTQADQIRTFLPNVSTQIVKAAIPSIAFVTSCAIRAGVTKPSDMEYLRQEATIYQGAKEYESTRQTNERRIFGEFLYQYEHFLARLQIIQDLEMIQNCQICCLPATRQYVACQHRSICQQCFLDQLCSECPLCGASSMSVEV